MNLHSFGQGSPTCLKFGLYVGLHPLKGSSHAPKDFVYGDHSTKKCTFALVNTSIIIKKCISLLQHRFITPKAYLKA